MIILEYNNCNNCLHNNVCKYIENRNEIITKMNGKLDNIVVEDSAPFEIEFNCKGFKAEEGIIKTHPTFLNRNNI